MRLRNKKNSVSMSAFLLTVACLIFSCAAIRADDTIVFATTDPEENALSKWESLQNRNFWVTYRIGVKKCEEMLPKVLNPERIDAVALDIQGLRMVLKRRTDVYVGIEFYVEPLLKTDVFSNTPIYKAGVLAEVPNHGFFHKKHGELVPNLEAMLKAMKEEGLFDKYDALTAE